MRKCKLLFLLMICVLSAHAQVPQSERDALNALYAALDGPNWSVQTNWGSGAPVDDWYGVNVTGNTVTEIFLNNNGLSGTMPDLSDLPGLSILRLQQNDISGDISTILDDIPGIRILDLSSNNITGNLPASIGTMTDIFNVNLSDNGITGSIPVEIGDATTLGYLSIYENNLIGSIPSTIGQLTSLIELKLYGNTLSGSLPAELGDMTALEDLNLSGNAFSGSIPTDLGDLSALRILNLSQANLGGTLPSSLGSITTLQTLDLTGNNVSGSIPTEFGDFLALQRLWLSSNDLESEIPDELGGISTLTSLKLDNNELTGSIPSTLGNLPALQTLLLDNNDLSGSIPSSLGNLSTVTSMDLSKNMLGGTIPSTFSGLTALEDLRLEENMLEGAVPTALLGLANLDKLSIYSNELDGLPNLSGMGLSELLLYDNYFTFEDLEPNVGIPGTVQMYQKLIIADDVIEVDDGDPLNISFSVGGSSNEYQWYFNNQTMSGEISNTLNIPSVELADGGFYKLVITSPLVPGVTLSTEDIFVDVQIEILNFYWVENGGSWEDLSHWATTSGGAVKHTELPRIVDNVYFDANSFTLPGQVVTVPDNGDDVGVKFHDMDWTGVTNQPTFQIIADKVLNPGGSGSNTRVNSISGSVTFVEDMTLDFVGCDFYFSGVQPYEIDMKGQYLGVSSFVTINADNFSPFGSGNGPANIISDLHTDWLLIFRGELITNGHTITASQYFWAFGSDDKFIDISGSVIETSRWTIDAIESFTPDGSTIRMIDEGVTAVFDGKNLEYHNLENEADKLQINGSNRFNTISSGPGLELSLQSLKIQTIEDLQIAGEPGNPATITAISGGSPGFFAKSSGVVTVDWTDLLDNSAVGGATFNATRSNDLGNVSGWNFVCEVTSDFEITMETCEGAADAIIEAIPPPNAGDLTYQLNGGTGQSSPVFDNLAADTYTITITDSFGCNDDFIVIVNPTIDPTWYADDDGDGFGDIADPLTACSQPVGYVDNADDCDDSNPNIPQIWYQDLDGDDWGDAAVSTVSCTQPVGYVENDGDCDPNDPFINPDQEDTPGSGVDANCDNLYTWFIDNDGDGFAGESTVESSNASPGSGEYEEATDCDDADDSIHPETIWYADQDGDGYGDPETTTQSCTQPVDFVSNADDCHPEDANLNPDASDTPGTGVDANCDGTYLWYTDEDGDGFSGSTTISSDNASPGAGEFAEITDCDDTNATVYPDAPHLPDGLDNDCDGTVDKGAQTIEVTEQNDVPHRSVQTITLEGTATSGLEITYSVEGPATISGNILTIENAGEVTVTAIQSGNDLYLPSNEETYTFCITPTPEISLGATEDATVKLVSNYAEGNQWYFEGEPIEGANESTYAAMETGTYVLEVSLNGCSAVSSEEEIEVSGLLDISALIAVYPNPASQYVRITLPENTLRMQIVGPDGRRIMEKRAPSRYMQIEVGSYPDGLYQVVFRTAEGWGATRFVKQ